jgi:ABC-type iron transport system FetAB permease component
MSYKSELKEEIKALKQPQTLMMLSGILGVGYLLSYIFKFNTKWLGIPLMVFAIVIFILRANIKKEKNK